MTEVFKEQIRDLEKIVPSYKIANAVVHYDEASPHLHIVGVPVKDGNKNGKKKQVGKSTVFTKQSLHEIQDTIRIYCKESFNKIYETNIELLDKLEGRNEDIETKNMAKQYTYLKEKADRNREKLDKVNKQTETTLSKSKEVKEIISNLKPTKITKNNFIINDEEIDVINNYIENVDKNVSDIKSANDLTSLMEDFERYLETHDKEVNDLKVMVDNQSKRIKTLESQNIKKQDKIAKQREEINDLEQKISRSEKIIQMWQQLWQRIRDFFQNKFFSSKKEDKIYEQVIDEMLEEEILDNEDIDYIQSGYYLKNNDDFDMNR